MLTLFFLHMDNVVYCLSCTKCPLTVYIGETGRRLAKHFGEHCRDVSNGRHDLPVPAHFNQANQTQEDMKVAVLNAGLANQEHSKKQKMIFRWFFKKNGVVGPSGLNQDFILMWITHFLLIQAQARAVTWGGKRVGNETSTPLFKWCVMQSRTGNRALRASSVIQFDPNWFQFDPSLLRHTFLRLFHHPTLRTFICPAVTCGTCASMQSGTCQSSLPNVHCQQTFGARQTINHVVHDAGKKSCDVNIPLGCCNCGWWIDIGTHEANVWANLTNF